MVAHEGFTDGAGPVPNKYRELIGIGVAAATKCRYCIFFHREMAKLEGATDAEIEDAVHFAKSTSGWSTYIQGLDYDYDTFKKEVRQAADYVRKQQRRWPPDSAVASGYIDD